MKKGQFYLAAIVIIISVFMGFVTITNYSKVTELDDLDNIKQELNIEKRYILDYLSYNQLNDIEEENILINFSRNYVNKIGANKDSLFIIAKDNSMRIIGNKLDRTIILVDSGNGYENITGNGYIENTYIINDEIKIKIDEVENSFNLREGQNFYYLVHYFNDNERQMVNG